MSRILVVDDTFDCLEPLIKLLRLEGHQVQGAGNGQEALAILPECLPDTIILDLMMPVMDGMTFLEHLRADPQWQTIRVMIFTGYGEGVDIHKLVELGVGEVFLKANIDYDHLLKLVA